MIYIRADGDMEPIVGPIIKGPDLKREKYEKQLAEIKKFPYEEDTKICEVDVKNK